MDRDIEQAADQTATTNPTPVYYQWPPTGQNPGKNPPAGRSGATQPDPAAYDAVRQCVTDHTTYGESGGWVLTTKTRGEFAAALLDAVAAVIVPATAEHIAAAIETVGGDPSHRECYEHAAEIARAAGRSAGATGGDSDGD